MYTVELTNNSMPFADDSNYDVELVVISKNTFEDKKSANKHFKTIAKQNNMRIFHNEAAGNGLMLYKNF